MKLSISPAALEKTRHRNVISVAFGQKSWRIFTASGPLGQAAKKRHQLLGSPDEMVSEIIPEGTSHRWAMAVRTKDARMNAEDSRTIGAKIVRKIPSGINRIDIEAVPPSSWKDLLPVLEGMELALYDQKHLGYKKDPKKPRILEVVLHTGTRSPSVRSEAQAMLSEFERRMEAVKTARILVDTPPVDMGPEDLATYVRDRFSGTEISVRIRDEKWLRDNGFNLHLAVSSGSERPPRLIHLTWGSGPRHVAVIGKGVTFDSGGLSIKHPNKYMEDMKSDMAGAAAVLGLFDYLRGMEPPKDMTIHGIAAATDNMPDAASIKPGDVITGHAGKSVEILNTDAEGRLVLADSISYAVRDLGADRVLTLATLTGACMVALGPYTAGWFARGDRWARTISGAINSSGESFWRMPLSENLRSALKSPIADMKNVGGSYGGAITAALFLEAFAGDASFAHMDIAGPAFLSSSHGPYSKGATGFGVLTLIELVNSLS